MSHFRGVVCLSLLLVPCPVAVATSPSDAATAPTRAPSEGERGGVTGEVEAAVRAWLRASHEALAEEKALRGRKMTWQMVFDAIEPENALAMARARRATGAASPEDIERIETSDRRRRKGPDVSPYTVWFLDRQHWRLNQEVLEGGEDLAFVDRVANGSTVWVSLPRRVYVGDSAKPIEKGWGPVEGLSRIQHAYARLIAAGVLTFAGQVESCEVIRVSEGNIAVRQRLPNGNLSELTLRPLSGGEFRSVRQRTFSASSGALVAHVDFMDFRSDPLVGREIATRIRYQQFGEAEPLSFEFQLISLEVVPEHELRLLLEAPSVHIPDPLRHETPIARVFDLNSTKPGLPPSGLADEQGTPLPPRGRTEPRTRPVAPREVPHISGSPDAGLAHSTEAAEGPSLDTSGAESFSWHLVLGTLTVLAGGGAIGWIRHRSRARSGAAFTGT